MKLPTAPDATVELFAAAVPDPPGVERRKMFGYPAAFVNRNLFMSVYGADIVLRLSDDDRSALGALGASRFEPMPCRPMTGYVIVAAAGRDDPAALDEWAGRALAHAAAPPPTAARAARR